MADSDSTTTQIDLSPSGDGKVMKEILTAGSGDTFPVKGNDVTVHYTGTLTDGTKFDSSKDRNDPFVFPLGQGRVIKGWDICVASMLKGEICKVTLAPEFAYGANGSPPKIPPNATLVFEIELISWVKEKDVSPQKDGSVLKEEIVSGEGYHTPSYETVCEYDISVVGPSGDALVTQNGIKSVIGDDVLPAGIAIALKSMKKGEKSIFTLQSSMAANETAGELQSYYTDLPKEVLTATITLHDFVKEKEGYEMDSFEEKEAAVGRRKAAGNDYFKKQLYAKAIQKYEKAISLCEYDEASLSADEKKALSAVKLACYLNTSMCQVKQKAYSSAVAAADKAIEIDPNSIKALFRRGTAKMEMQEFMDAKNDFKKVLEIDSENVAAKKAQLKLKRLMAIQDRKEKNLYKNMFGGLSSSSPAEKEAPASDSGAPAGASDVEMKEATTSD